MFYKSVVVWKCLVLVTICTSAANPTCHSGAFSCARGRCIPLPWQCDGDDDCGDNSDEENCEHRALLINNATNLLLLDLETHEETIIAGDLGLIHAIDYDYERRVVLWTDKLKKRIYRITLHNRTSNQNSPTGSKIVTVIKDKRINSEGIAADWIHGNVYWTDRDRRTISVATLDGEVERLLFQKNITHPVAIVVNPLEGWFFWTDVSRPAKIERAGMDGSERSVIISEDIDTPTALAIDFGTKKLFWLDSNLHTLSSSDYDGSNRRLILSSSSQFEFAFALDVFEDWLYWAYSSPGGIKRVNKFSGTNLKIIASDLINVTDLKVYHSSKQPKGINYCDNMNSTCSHFCLPAPHVSEESPKFTCFCPDGMILGEDNKMCVPEPAALLFKNASNLLLSDLETHEDTIIASGLGMIRAVDYDHARGVVLWIDKLKKRIYRITYHNTTYNPNSPSDSNIDTVVKDERINSEGIAVDWIHGNVYWTDRDRKTINVATLDGEVERLLFQKNIIHPGAVAVNPLEGWFFWTDSGTPAKIERAGMDGSERSVLISEDIDTPSALAIDFMTKKVFWVDSNLHTLSSADYDGSNRRIILSSPSEVGFAFALDVFEDWLYWSDWSSGSIKRINKISGTNLTIVASEIDYIIGLKIYHSSKQPKGINYCVNINSACSHFCLPAPHVTEKSRKFTCFCPDELILGDDKKTCVTEHRALLLNNATNLLLLDLETDEETIIASGLDRISAIDYDYARGVVLWSDAQNETFHRISLQNRTSPNGSNIDNVVKDELVYSMGIAVDWIHGNVYWTKSVRNTINVATLDGSIVRVLFHNNITFPAAIVVNPLEGWIFWTDFGPPPTIERAGMDGTERSVIISEDLVFPTGLAIDFLTKKLFWADSMLDTMSSSDYDGSNRRLILSSSSEYGFAVGLDVFEDWLYWSDWQSESIKKVNKSTGTNFTIVASEIISNKDFKIYHSHKQPKGINYCDDINSACSHFCLPAPHVTEESTKFTCFCPDGMILGNDKKICVPDVCEIKEKTCTGKDMECEVDRTTNEGFKCVCKTGNEDNGDGTCKTEH